MLVGFGLPRPSPVETLKIRPKPAGTGTVSLGQYTRVVPQPSFASLVEAYRGHQPVVHAPKVSTWGHWILS